MSDEGVDDNNLEFGEEHLGKEKEVRKEERGVESVRERNKRIKEMSIDRLSKLPDHLLIHILSFLGVERAGVTTVLSKRWNGLWAELPRLEFWECLEIEKPLNFVSCVNRTLHIRKGDYLEKFVVKFINYKECFASDVDVWVEYSVKNGVKEVVLIMYSHDYYKPPQMMYSCSSLTDLHLSGCIMSSESRIKWQSLTRLSLCDVELNQPLIDEILSGCPVLKILDLEACWGFNRLEVNSRCLNYLRVQEPDDDDDDDDDDEPLEISAPYVPNLNIKVFLEERKWQPKNISSVVGAYINFFESVGGVSGEVMTNANEFIEKFKQVNKLSIAKQCFEVLSIIAVNGWQLPQFKLQDLSLISCNEFEHSISGIIALLESSPNLETLHLEGYPINGGIVNLDPTAKSDLDGDLLHLKTIRVENLADQNGEPLLTFARILLNRAPALEEMLIVIDVEDKSVFVNIAQTLLTYPRSSTKAEIHLLSRK